MRLRLPGEGEPSPNGGPRGDCYCFITVKEHPLFQRDGQHLIVPRADRLFAGGAGRDDRSAHARRAATS